MPPAENLTNKKSRLGSPYIYLFILVLIVGAGLWYWEKKPSSIKTPSSATKSQPDNWIVYKNSQYGVRFEYPKSWGKPKMSDYSRQKGRHYEIGFSADTKQDVSVTAAFDSQDEINPICNPDNSTQCVTTTAYTKEDVTKALSKNKEGYVKYDSTSYATLQTDPNSKIAGELYMYQIVDLSKIKATAAQIAYTRTGTAACPSGKLAADSLDGCVTTLSYNDLSRFAKSIKNL